MAGFAGPGNPFDDGSEVTTKSSLKLAWLGAGRENDALDETTQRVGGLVAVLGMVESIGKVRDLAAVNVCDVGMDIREVRIATSTCFTNGR